MHSSTVTVAVRDLDFSPGCTHPALLRADTDFVLEWFSGSGSGGQHRNKHANCARLKHHPTGVVVTSQCRRRPESELSARQEMIKRLDELVRQEIGRQISLDVHRQIGSGQRSDKRRTYRFQDGCVVDHVTGGSASLKHAMHGKIDRLWC